ncbi:hypothetical protein MPS_1133 [Mycobacterium pseudoshottsii JCM 15466]|nr:hypothetical protein MPS_1133 [Mycobacterium pseudoshottsii JCM 15466]
MAKVLEETLPFLRVGLRPVRARWGASARHQSILTPLALSTQPSDIYL